MERLDLIYRITSKLSQYKEREIWQIYEKEPFLFEQVVTSIAAALLNKLQNQIDSTCNVYFLLSI